MNNFHYSMVLMDNLYGITLPEDAFEELALNAWNLIGNKRYRLYRYSACIDQDNKIELPCNADIVEAVTASWEDWKDVSNLLPNGDIRSAYVEEYIEARKRCHSPLYQGGKFLPYERVVVDEDGLPEITDKEALAIATYCAYVTKFKEGLRTNNQNIIQLSAVLKRDWNTQCDQARVAEYLNQNEMDQILEAKTSWNRKIHNKSYKVFK